jgi:hypothetical protein
MTLLLLFSQPALAYSSEDQRVRLEDSAGIFENIQFTTGVIPEGSPIGVEFVVQSNGGTSVVMEGDASLSWPTNVTFAAVGEAMSGIFVLDCSLEAITSVVVDLSDYGGGSWSGEIDHRTLTMDGSTFFDPFVLEGAAEPRVEIIDTTDSTQLIQYSYEIFAGVSLDFQADMTPTFTVGFEGVQWLANEGVITQENTPVALTPEQAADFVVDTVFRGAYDGTIALVFTPQVAVTAPFLGTIPLISFEYPLELLSDSFEQDFIPASYTFPMPLLSPGSDSAPFGDIELGSIATINIPVQNLGNLALYGEARIEGDATFTVYPDQFNALPGTADGLVITYAPSAVASNVAELVLTSNDPGYPDIRVALSGAGIESDVPGVSKDEEITASTSGCGCSTPVGALPSAVVTLAMLGLAARRRG